MDVKPIRRIITSPFERYSILSYGIVLYCRNTKRYVMVRRKHSVEFVLLMKGRYEYSHLMVMMYGMTDEEIKIVERCIVDNEQGLFVEKMREVINGYKNYQYSLTKFNEARGLIAKIIRKMKEKEYISPTLQWGWPKGIPNNKEDGLDCAYREFEEEVGIKIPSNIVNIIELNPQQFPNFASKNIKVTCWLIIIDYEFNIEEASLDDEEISDRKWMSENEVIEALKINRTNLSHSEPSVVHSSNLFKYIFDESKRYT